MNIYLKVWKPVRVVLIRSTCLFILELLIYYKNNNREIEYQDCYGAFIKVQDLIENFAESLTILV